MNNVDCFIYILVYLRQVWKDKNLVLSGANPLQMEPHFTILSKTTCHAFPLLHDSHHNMNFSSETEKQGLFIAHTSWLLNEICTRCYMCEHLVNLEWGILTLWINILSPGIGLHTSILLLHYGSSHTDTRYPFGVGITPVPYCQIGHMEPSYLLVPYQVSTICPLPSSFCLYIKRFCG